MDLSPTARGAELVERVSDFMAQHIEPVEDGYHREIARVRQTGGDPWQQLPLLGELRDAAREQGLWNLFLPREHAGDYAERFGTSAARGSATSTTRRLPS